jgi:hypothetical protein
MLDSRMTTLGLVVSKTYPRQVSIDPECPDRF